MPTIVNLKQSEQSLAARGLPVKRKESRRNDQPTAVSELSTQSDKVTSVNDGINRCNSLLTEMLGTPGDTSKQHKVIRNKKNLVGKQEKNQGICDVPQEKAATKKKKLIRKPQHGKTPIASTPSNLIVTVKNNEKTKKTNDTIVSSDTVDELIGEKEQLQNYLEQIAADKLRIKKTFENVMQDHLVEVKQLSANEPPQFHSSTEVTTGAPQPIQTAPLPMKQYKTPITQERVPGSSPINKWALSMERENLNDQLQDLMQSITSKLSLDKTDSSSTSQIERVQHRESIKHHDMRPLSPVPLSPRNIVNHTNSKSQFLAPLHGIDIKKIRGTPIEINPSQYPKPKEMMDRSTQNSPSGIKIGTCNCKKTETFQSKQPIEVPPHKVDNDSSAVKSHVHITTLKYMMKELNTLIGDKRDLQLDGLLNEIDHIIGLLPFTVGGESSNNFHMDLNLALQPLRVENTDLRRRYRLIEMKHKDLKFQIEALLREINEGKSREQNACIVIQELEKKMTYDEATMQQLTNQISDVCKVTEELKSENQNLLQALSNKETKQFDERSAWWNEKSTVTNELSRLQTIHQQNQLLLQTQEKEMNILQISTKQKDAEIERLNILNRDLQQSVSKLLADIHLKRETLLSTRKSKENRYNKSPSSRLTKNYKTRSERNNAKHSDMPNAFHQKPESRYPSSTNRTLHHNGKIFKPFTETTSTVENSSLDTLLNDIEGNSLSTLGTYDNLDFQRDLSHLENELSHIQKVLIKNHSAIHAERNEDLLIKSIRS